MKFSFEHELKELNELEALAGEDVLCLDEDVFDWSHMTAGFWGKIDDFASVSGQYGFGLNCFEELDIVAHIERIDVNEAHQLKGYARMLLRAVCARCPKCHRIYAAAESESAARFWEHIGGERVYDDVWGSLDVGHGVYCVAAWRILED